MVPTSCIRTLCTVIIVVLNSLSDNSSSPPGMFVSDVRFLSSNCGGFFSFSPFGMFCNFFLRARHEVLDGRNCCILVLVTQGEVGKHSGINEPHDFDKFLGLAPPPPGRTGWPGGPEWAALGVSSPPGQVSAGNTSWSLVTSFHWGGRTELPDGSFSPPPARSKRRLFSGVYYGGTLRCTSKVMPLEGHLKISCRGPLMPGSSGASGSESCAHRASKSVSHRWGFPVWHWFPQFLPLGEPWLPGSPSVSPILGTKVGPVSSPPLWTWEALLIFQAALSFVCEGNGGFIPAPWTWKRKQEMNHCHDTTDTILLPNQVLLRHRLTPWVRKPPTWTSFLRH